MYGIEYRFYNEVITFTFSYEEVLNICIYIYRERERVREKQSREENVIQYNNLMEILASVLFNSS